MKISQLTKVMDKDDEIIIDDGNKRIDRNRVYQGTVRGIKRDNPINKMHVVVIYPYDNKLLVLAEYPTEKGGATDTNVGDKTEKGGAE